MKKQKIIISDASCIIILEKIGELEILHKLFGSILTTTEIQQEFGKELPDWINIEKPSNEDYARLVRATLDSGEASAIALSLNYEDPLLILDDLKARNFANKIGINVTGTLGILLNAKSSGVLKSIKPVLANIEKTNFRLSRELVQKVLEIAGE